MEVRYKKGTTTLGIVTKDSVILAADKRASLGHLAMHAVMKIEQITDIIAMTTAGSVADNQLIAKYLRAEMKLYKLDTDVEPTIEIASSLLANILYGGKGFSPYAIFNLMAGTDKKGNFKLYSLFGDGSSISDKFTVSGSGMELALGVLEVGYKENLSTDEGVQLAVRAINTAMKRDIYSGEGINVVVINKDGFKRVSEKVVASFLKT